jgi:octaprenyl-diphosphate synthase
MAFQIKDDIFDYEKTSLLGKPTGNDIVENKITLPLIYALKQVDSKHQKEILKCVKNASTDRKYVSTVRDFVIDNNGLAYATSIAEEYVEKAIVKISTFDDSPAKHSLVHLAQYAVKRNE